MTISKDDKQFSRVLDEIDNLYLSKDAKFYVDSHYYDTVNIENTTEGVNYKITSFAEKGYIVQY